MEPNKLPSSKKIIEYDDDESDENLKEEEIPQPTKKNHHQKDLMQIQQINPLHEE